MSMSRTERPTAMNPLRRRLWGALLFLVLGGRALLASAACPPSGEAAKALAESRSAVASALEDRNRGAFDRAVVKLRRAGQLAPDCVDARRALAEALWNGSFDLGFDPAQAAGLQREARSVLESALAAAPADTGVLEDLATFATDDGDRLRRLTRIVEIMPDHPRAHRDLALLLLDRGEVERAIAEYQFHQRFAPYEGRESGAADTAFALDLLQRGRTADAGTILMRTLERTAGESRFERCWLIQPFATGPLATAPKTAEAIRELLPYCTSHEHRDKAAALENAGKIDAAVAEYRAQLAANPAFEETYFALDRLLRRQGLWQEAAAVLGKLVAREPEPAKRCALLARIDAETYQTHGAGELAEMKKGCPR
jgi:tetratricopeptide (TPR) repeat protein